MVDTKRNELDFEVLGYKVRLRPNTEASNQVHPKEVLRLVEREAQSIREVSGELENGKLALLVALKLATDKLSLEREYKDNINQLQAVAGDALQFIEEVSPSSI